MLGLSKYEFKILRKSEAQVEVLNNYGEEGWAIVAVDEYKIYMQREKQIKFDWPELRDEPGKHNVFMGEIQGFHGSNNEAGVILKPE
jgi:hypothetical protein